MELGWTLGLRGNHFLHPSLNTLSKQLRETEQQEEKDKMRLYSIAFTKDTGVPMPSHFNQEGITQNRSNWIGSPGTARTFILSCTLRKANIEEHFRGDGTRHKD